MANQREWAIWGVAGVVLAIVMVLPTPYRWWVAGAVLVVLVVALLVELLVGRQVQQRLTRARDGIAPRSRTQRRLSWLLYAAFLLAPMTQFRAGSAVNASDVFIYLALGYSIFKGRVGSFHGYGLVLTAAWLMAVGGLIGTWLFSDMAGESVGLILRMLVGIAAPLLAVCWWRPDRQEIGNAIFAFALGVVTSIGSAAAGSTAYGRFYGLSLHPVLLGLMCVLAIMGLIGVRDRSPWLALALIAVATYGLLETGTRAALVALVVALGAFLLARGDRRVALTVGLAAVVGVALVLTGTIEVSETNVVARLTGDRSSIVSNAERTQAGDRARQIIEDHPFTGTGFASSRDQTLTLPTISAAHSVPLAAWSSAGVLGLIGVGLIAIATWRTWRRSRTDLLACGLACGFVGYVVFALLATQIWERFIWLMVALAVEAVRVARPTRSDHDGAVDAEARIQGSDSVALNPLDPQAVGAEQ